MPDTLAPLLEGFDFAKPCKNDDLAALRAQVLHVNALIDDRLQAGALDIKDALLLRTLAYQKALIALFEALDLGKSAALFAVGGFGRREVLPRSDVDILVVYTDDDAPANLRLFMARVWDIGLHPALILRRANESDCSDISLATSFLQSRFLAGRADLWDLPKNWVKNAWDTRRFWQAKTEEADKRRARFGRFHHSLEPDIKEGVGGLRDIHLIVWLGAFVLDLPADASLEALLGKFLDVDERHALCQAQRFFWTLRHHLHTLAQKGDDKLDFGAQKKVAARMGYPKKADNPNADLEALMKDYYHHAMATTGLCAMLTRLFYDTFLSQNRRLRAINDDFVAVDEDGQKRTIAARDVGVFEKKAATILQIFVLMADHDIAYIDAKTLRFLRKAAARIDDAYRADPLHRDLFVANLTKTNYLYHRLYLMKYTGALPKYLPQFAPIVGLMQYDLFHRYTVDTHTLLLLRFLHRFKKNTHGEFDLAHKLYCALPNPLPLTVAVLFHDIGKGQGGDHSQVGAKAVDDFCVAHRLSDADRRLAVWLVRHHLDMSIAAQKKDIDDPQVINDFARFVGNTRRLDHLYLLTVADMNATNAQLWNDWRAALLKKLYLSCHYALKGDQKVQAAHLIERKKSQARRRLDPQSARRANRLWQNLPEAYFLKESAINIAWHTQAILARDKSDAPLIALRPRSDGLRADKLLIYTPNRANLFARTVAVLDAFGYSVFGANIVTTADNYALDSYTLVNDLLACNSATDDVLNRQSQKHTQNANDNEKQRLINRLREAVTAGGAIDEPIPKLVTGRSPLKHFCIATQIHFEKTTDGQRHYLHITTKDQTSLLAKIGLVFSRFGLSVHSAKIATLGERAEDVFCVSESDGPLSLERQKAIAKALKKALGE